MTKINTSKLVIKKSRNPTPDLPKVNHKKSLIDFDIGYTHNIIDMAQNFIPKICTNQNGKSGSRPRHKHSYTFSTNVNPPLSCETRGSTKFSSKGKKKLLQSQIIPPMDLSKELEIQLGANERTGYIKSELNSSRVSLARIDYENSSIDNQLKILNKPKRGAGNFAHVAKCIKGKVKGFENIDLLLKKKRIRHDPYDITQEHSKFTNNFPLELHIQESTGKKSTTKTGKLLAKKKIHDASAIINQSWHNNYLLENYSGVVNKKHNRKISKDQMAYIRETSARHHESEKGNYKFMDHKNKPVPLANSKTLLICSIHNLGNS